MASLRPVSRSRASRTTALTFLLSASVGACGDPHVPTAVTSTTSGLAAELTEPGVTAGLTVYGLGGLRPATPQSPCTESAFRQFDFWVGDWIATSAGGPPGGTPSRIATALDGCAILEQWGGGGRSLNSYDPETGLWHQTWVPGAGRFPFRMAGGLQPDGKMVLRGVRHPWFAPNASWIDVYTWTPVDADHVIQAFTFDVVPGGFHLQGQLGYERTTNLPPINPPSTTRCQPGGEAGETRLLDFTLGRWTVSAANGLELGTSEIALDPVLSGCLLEEKFTTAKGYEAIGWMYYDPVENAFYRSYVDSEGERLELRGEVSSSPVALEGAEPIPGASDAHVRVTWTSVSADRLEQRWELSKDGGATWREVQTLVFTRA